MTLAALRQERDDFRGYNAEVVLDEIERLQKIEALIHEVIRECRHPFIIKGVSETMQDAAVQLTDPDSDFVRGFMQDGLQVALNLAQGEL